MPTPTPTPTPTTHRTYVAYRPQADPRYPYFPHCACGWTIDTGGFTHAHAHEIAEMHVTEMRITEQHPEFLRRTTEETR